MEWNVMYITHGIIRNLAMEKRDLITKDGVLIRQMVINETKLKW